MLLSLQASEVNLCLYTIVLAQAQTKLTKSKNLASMSYASAERRLKIITLIISCMPKLIAKHKMSKEKKSLDACSARSYQESGIAKNRIKIVHSLT